MVVVLKVWLMGLQISGNILKKTSSKPFELIENFWLICIKICRERKNRILSIKV